jgi:hypothetical protein
MLELTKSSKTSYLLDQVFINWSMQRISASMGSNSIACKKKPHSSPQTIAGSFPGSRAFASCRLISLRQTTGSQGTRRGHQPENVADPSILLPCVLPKLVSMPRAVVLPPSGVLFFNAGRVDPRQVVIPSPRRPAWKAPARFSARRPRTRDNNPRITQTCSIGLMRTAS